MRRRYEPVALAALAALGLASLAAWARLEAAEPAPDARQPVTLPAAARSKVLTEMRGMLESLSLVLQALARNDLPAAGRAARAAGMAAASEVAPEVRQRLPQPFLQLGMQTHRAFDALADQITAGAAPDEALRSAAALTGNCVACHATYRLEEAR